MESCAKCGKEEPNMYAVCSHCRKLKCLPCFDESYPPSGCRGICCSDCVNLCDCNALESYNKCDNCSTPEKHIKQCLHCLKNQCPSCFNGPDMFFGFRGPCCYSCKNICNCEKETHTVNTPSLFKTKINEFY